MKKIFPFLLLIIISVSCKKDIQEVTGSSPQNVSEGILNAKGSGSGNGDNGGNNQAGFLQNAFPGAAYRLIAGDNSSIFASFTQLSPPGWILHLTSNDPAVQVPANYPVPAGVFNAEPPITSTAVSNSRQVTVSVSLGSQTKSTTFKIFPRTATFPAPQLQSPGDGAGFKNRLQVRFTWSDNVNAYYHDIQISDNPAFSNVPILEVYLNDPIWAASYFNGLGNRYWRVRYIDASGNFGPWSAVRRFEIKP